MGVCVGWYRVGGAASPKAKVNRRKKKICYHCQKVKEKEELVLVLGEEKLHPESPTKPVCGVVLQGVRDILWHPGAFCLRPSSFHDKPLVRRGKGRRGKRKKRVPLSLHTKINGLLCLPAAFSSLLPCPVRTSWLAYGRRTIIGPTIKSRELVNRVMICQSSDAEKK